MHQFAPGIAKTAITPITVRPSGLSCQAEIFLGPDPTTKVATSGPVAFISTGARQDVRLPVTMPPSVGTYHAYIDVYAEGMLIAAYKAIQDVVIALPLPSALLISYHSALCEAYIAVEAGYPNDWVMIPGFGLQYASAAINQIKNLMFEEAVSIGMISSVDEGYFIRDVMYFSDGTTIVPYWFSCPYCPEKFRSPDLLAQHKEEMHGDIILTKAAITGAYPHSVCLDPPWCDFWQAVNFTVTWRNDSPFPITGRISIPGSGSKDALASPGQQVTVSLPLGSARGYSIPVTLTLVGEPLPGMLLDTYSFDFHG